MKIKNYLRKILNKLSEKQFVSKVLNTLDVNVVFLNYHRVIKNQDYNNIIRPNDDLVVTSEVFEKQVKYLTKNYNVISINDINSTKGNKKIILTFDDGYIDNLENALPILEKYNCPATIYIITSLIDNLEYPWWLKMWEIIVNNENILIEGKKIQIRNKKEKIEIYKNLCKELIEKKKIYQDAYFNDIIIKNNLDVFFKKEFLTTENLKYLGNHELIEIGCHTHNHENLKILDETEINLDLKKSLNILENILQKKIFHFSIPYGSKNHFSNDTIKFISKFNFKTVVTTEHGIYKRNLINRIPRIGVGNLDLDERLNSKALGLDSLINKLAQR